MENLRNVRNIGISAHIDSGKTTLTERVLYYSGKSHSIKEVRGEGAKMDHMELEKERGITITSAATTVQWLDKKINIIDTPGHVDFTVEVERSLRVLDGAVLVLCAVAGVQSQSITVDRQMKRYRVPRLAFINKMDRTGANPGNVISQLESKLGLTTVPIQIPMGGEINFGGVIDLINREAVYFDGDKGETVRREPIPAEFVEPAERARQGMLEALSLVSDRIMELLLEEQEVPLDLIHATIREATVAQQICPVLVGSAYKNKGVQLLLDAVNAYLPSPLDREIHAKDNNDGMAEVALTADPTEPMVAMAFKLVEEAFGQVTYMRIYQGTLTKGSSTGIPASGRRPGSAGSSGSTPTRRKTSTRPRPATSSPSWASSARPATPTATRARTLSLESIYAAEPVIDLAVSPNKRGRPGQAVQGPEPLHAGRPHVPGPCGQGDQRDDHLRDGRAPPGDLRRADPREYKVDCTVGMPKVSYREAPTKVTTFDYKHRKQTGGSGQYAHIKGVLEPMPEDSTEQFVFENDVTGGRIPSEYIPSVEKGFRDSLHKGPVAGYEVLGVKMILQDGSYHDVDSSDMAFQICARDCFRETFRKADPVLLEPIMKVEVEVPTEFLGPRPGRRLVEAGRDPRDRGPGPVLRHHGRGPALGDVRLLQRPPEHDPGQGLLQHGVPQVPEAPRPLSGRGRQEGRAGEGQGLTPS